MGGGIVFRRVSQLVGAATVGAAVTPSKGAFCHVRPSPSSFSREQDSLLAVLDDAETEVCNANLSDKDFQSYVNVRYEHEDSDIDTSESSTRGAFRQLVFHPPPTEEEVEEATKELHAAFHLSMPSQAFVPEDNQGDLLVGLTVDADDTGMASLFPKTGELVAPASFTQPYNHLGNVENSSVMQAFQLLQANPKVQEVVKSLACDPAVWNAVLSNEKLLELTQEQVPDSQDPIDYDDDDYVELKELGTVLASKLFGLMSTTKVYYSYVRGKLFSLLNVIFGSVEKTLWTKGQTAKDKTKASCMMLTVAVVILVVLQRSLKKGKDCSRS